MLRSGELCVCQITEVLRLAQSTVSTHLRELKRAGLVTERKHGRWVYFGLSSHGEARAWMDAAFATLAGDPGLEGDRLLVREIRDLPVEDVCRLGFEKARAKADCGKNARTGGGKCR
jgi:DNA-binding transcriptional ArsR family regulator